MKIRNTTQFIIIKSYRFVTIHFHHNDHLYPGTGGVHKCTVCHVQLDNWSMSRPLTKNDGTLYGIKEADVTGDMRVCSNCRCRSVRRRYK